MNSKYIDPKKIKETREKFNMTLRDASEVIGVSEAAWCRWERGQRNMRRVLYEIFNIKIKEKKDEKNV